MVDGACLRVKSNSMLQKKITEATSDELADYISSLQKNHIPCSSSTPESAFLDAVNSITYALPHSNEDAKSNRKKAFSMQIRFGFPFVFFTVTPDDSSSYAVSIYAGLAFNTGDKLCSLTNDDLIKRAKKRQMFRIRHAGVGALWYYSVMNAVWKTVIGWDWLTKTASPGLYGVPEAAIQGTEEQTRKRLHGHCLVWIKGASSLVQRLQSVNDDDVLFAEQRLAAIFDRSTCTSFLDKKTFPNNAFQHNEPCTTIRQQSRRKPDVVDAQQLRDMRHKVGKNMHDGVIAKCKKCNHHYTVEELVISYLNHQNERFDSHDIAVTSWTSRHKVSDDEEDVPTIMGKKKMEELLFLLSIPQATRYPHLSELITNAVQNLHAYTHIAQCFKKGEECRYHLPTLPVATTMLQVVDEFRDWYDYEGNKIVYRVYDIIPKRSEYDVFQNQCCTAISLSRLGSNSNSQLCVSGQKAMYITKYPTKSTQKEDEGEYENVLHYSSVRLSDRRFDNDCSEAMSRAIGATFAHNSSNVISAWLAKYLINERSRFRFSHEFRNVPQMSIQEEIMNNNSRWRKLKNYDGELYIDSSALKYVHRPASLERVGLTDFVVKYHVARKSDYNQKHMLHFEESDTYSAGQYQGILLSKNKMEYIPDINIWGFPDAANFAGKLLDTDSVPCAEMEKYALEVLICFCPFKSFDDLMLNYSHVEKFRTWYLELKQSSPSKFHHIHHILTNIQALKNSLRIHGKDDLLCEETHMFVDPDGLPTKGTSNNQHEKKRPCYTDKANEFIQSMLLCELKKLSQITFKQCTDLSLIELRKKGTWKCGFENIVSMDERAKFFNIYSDRRIYSATQVTSISREAITILQGLRKQMLVDVMLERTVCQHSQRATDMKNNMEVQQKLKTTTSSTDFDDIDIDANGTPESIHLWAKQCFSNDNEQQRAFEILAATFVLRYCSEADDNENLNNTISGTARHHYIRCKKVLQQMVGKPSKTGQLIMFVTGPGGSGKSEIINELLRYAEKFCSNLNQPFTRNTILVTACSGVAATLIHGQTLHSATFLNTNIRNIDTDEKAKFRNCVKMVIVDEISMLGGVEIKALSKRLNWLTDDRSGVYGNMHIVFMGDFRQLPPISKKPIYATTVVEFTSFINCFISLKGQY